MTLLTILKGATLILLTIVLGAAFFIAFIPDDDPHYTDYED